MDNKSKKDRRQAIRRKGFTWTNKSAVRLRSLNNIKTFILGFLYKLGGVKN